MFDPDYDIFIDILDSGSISAAARERGLSVASLSKRLARLEDKLGTRLIHRTTRRLALTPAGQDLRETLLPLRASLRAVEDRIAGRSGAIAGPLRLSAPTSFGRMHIVPVLPEFMRLYPDVDLQIDLSDEFIDLLEGAYDLAIRIAGQIDAGLVGHRLAMSSRVLCAAPAYLARHGEPRSLEDLSCHTILAAESQTPWRLDGPDGTVIHHCTSHIRTNSSEVVRELAVGGCGIALRSLWDVKDALQSGALQRVLPDYQGSQEVGIFAVHAPTPVLPVRIKALVEHLRAEVGLRLDS